MSSSALEAKKQVMSDYFTYHPDAQEIEIVDSEDTFWGLFDHAYRDAYKDTGNVTGMKKEPHVTFYGGDEALFTARETQLTIGTRIYQIIQKRYDETDGTYQGELWLV